MAPDTEAARVVEDVIELVNIVSLDDIYVYEERGRRIIETATDQDPSDASDPTITNVLNVSDMVANDGSYALGFRFRLVFDDRIGNEFVADVQARYGLPGKCEVSADIRTEFAERVAFFAVYPYLRASIQMSASRMSAPAPVLAIVRNGEFKLGEQLPQEVGRAQFNDTAPENS